MLDFAQSQESIYIVCYSVHRAKRAYRMLLCAQSESVVYNTFVYGLAKNIPVLYYPNSVHSLKSKLFLCLQLYSTVYLLHCTVHAACPLHIYFLSVWAIVRIMLNICSSIAIFIVNKLHKLLYLLRFSPGVGMRFFSWRVVAIAFQKDPVYFALLRYYFRPLARYRRFYLPTWYD